MERAGPGDPREGDGVEALAGALAEVGRRVRDEVRRDLGATGDADVTREAGGDEIFGVDVRAEEALLAGLAEVGERWPGTLVVEGCDEPAPVGDGQGPWCFLVDPVDGTRPLLAGLASAWVLLGAGRRAATLEDLEVGAAVEIPTARAALGRVAWAVRGGPARAVDDDLWGGGPPRPVRLEPRTGPIERSFVTVARFAPGDHGPIGAWLDDHLAGLEVYDHLLPCSGGTLMEIASGAATAAFDVRPLLRPGSLAAHPYDLAALVVARAAGVVVEALPPGPLTVPLDTTTPVAWAAYATPELAGRLRPPPGSVVRGAHRPRRATMPRPSG